MSFCLSATRRLDSRVTVVAERPLLAELAWSASGIPSSLQGVGSGHQPLDALDQFDLVAIRILDERDDCRATFDRPRLARHLAT